MKTSHDAALLVGLDTPDDAAVYQVAPDLALVQTVDFFTPIVDDAYAWGRIAAANALSDVYAMGGTPLTALNLVAWPRSLGFESLGRVLDGGADACEEAGVAIVGGHSVDDPEPKYGLSVTGTVHPDRIIRKTGALPGADLVLTKPLGTGIISSGLKEGSARSDWVAEATRTMTALNRGAADAMAVVGVQAATDVTGFGFIGHLLQMLDGVSAEIDLASVPVLPGAVDLAARGVLPGGSKRNLDAMEGSVDDGVVDPALRAVLYDAQTSGGMLIAVDEVRTAALLAALGDRDVQGAVRVGRVVTADDRQVKIR